MDNNTLEFTARSAPKLKVDVISELKYKILMSENLEYVYKI